MRVSVFYIATILCFLVASVKCQEEDGNDGFWSKLKKAVKDFVNSIREVWNDLKAEIKARTTDMQEWSKEIFIKFKASMNQWINEVNGASDTEKEDMRKYVERLEMPKE